MSKQSSMVSASWERLQELTTSIRGAETIEELYAAGLRIIELFECEHFVFRLQFGTSATGAKLLLLSNQPSWWRHRYLSMNYHLVDPVARHCRMHTSPIELTDLLAWPDVTNDLRQSFLSDLRNVGMQNGFGVPLHGVGGEWGMLILTWRSEHAVGPDRSRIVPFLTLLAAYMQDSARRLVLKRTSIVPEHRLTKREKECLFWTAEGKTSWETSKILNISERTVVYHLQNVVEKLQVSNRAQAVARAMGLLISDPEINNGILLQGWNGDADDRLIVDGL